MNNNKNPYDDTSNGHTGGQSFYDTSAPYPTSQKPLDDPQINPSYPVAPNGQPSMPNDYGNRQTVNQYSGIEPGRQTGMIGMILGIVGMVLSLVCTCISLIFPTVSLILDLAAVGCSIAAVVTGVMSGNTDAASGIPRNGFSVAAIVCGIIGIIFGVIALGCLGCVSCVLSSSCRLPTA